MYKNIHDILLLIIFDTITFLFLGVNIKSFLKVDKDIFFSTCEACEARCCDGKRGSIFCQIILEDFQSVYKNFPILFTFGDMGYLKATILLSDGKNFCPYINNFKCTIYENRPTVCKAYPLSTNIDNVIYYDLYCPGVSEYGSEVVKDYKVSPSFNSYIFDDYQTRYINTHRKLEEFNHFEDFELVTTINNNKFYKYIGNLSNPYISMHIESLIHLKKYNI